MKTFDGRDLSGAARRITVRDGRIESSIPLDTQSELPRLLPVLTDLQQNGALGHAFSDCGPEALHEIRTYLLKCGVGRIFATFNTSPKELLLKGVENFGKALNESPELDSFYAGIFHEGVFISPEEGWRGAHNPDFIFPPDWEYMDRFNRLSGNRLRLINIAPEVPGAAEFIANARKNGIEISIGHCNPTPAQIRAVAPAFVTHLGNGSPALVPRFMNPFWEYLSNDSLTVGLICDGFHIPPELARTAVKAKKNWFAVSDASSHSGLPPGKYMEDGLEVEVDPRGVLVLSGTQLLAGAWRQQNHSVEFLVNEVGLSFEEAWRRCSTIPAGYFNLDLPLLRPGDRAEFVVAEWKNDQLNILHTEA